MKIFTKYLPVFVKYNLLKLYYTYKTNLNRWIWNGLMSMWQSFQFNRALACYWMFLNTYISWQCIEIRIIQMKIKNKGIVKNIEIPSNQTKGTIKTQNPKDKTITWNKESEMTWQHEPLWNQRWNQVLRKGKHSLLDMRHPS